MDANVMKRYTTNPTQPRHFVQVSIFQIFSMFMIRYFIMYLNKFKN